MFSGTPVNVWVVVAFCAYVFVLRSCACEVYDTYMYISIYSYVYIYIYICVCVFVSVRIRCVYGESLCLFFALQLVFVCTCVTSDERSACWIVRLTFMFTPPLYC